MKHDLNTEKRALHLLWEIYYKRLRDVWPEDVHQKLEEGDFDNPIPPYYYQAK